MSKLEKDKYLSSRGYIFRKHKLTPRREAQIRKDLTVSPFVDKRYAFGNQAKFKVFLENQNKFYLPRFYALEKFGDPDEDYLKERGASLSESAKFVKTLRPQQVPIVNNIMDKLQNRGGVILNAACASGKTCMSIKIIELIGKRALVIVHKEFLLNQWIERIQEFMPGAKIGLVQANKVIIDGCDIILAMLQSLSIKSYPPDTFESIGFTIVDECHHTGAEIFSRALAKVSTKYMLGLSATPDRKDGLRKVFEWYLGPSDVVIPPRETGKVIVEIHPFSSGDSIKVATTAMGTPNTAKLLGDIVEADGRNDLIIDLALKCLLKEDRKILIMSERREHLDDLAKLLNIKYCEKTGKDAPTPGLWGFYRGGMKQDELKISEDAAIILGTFSMISEGFDVATLDTLILATPKSDIVQTAGRILRKEEKDRERCPLIVDILDIDVSLMANRLKARMRYYKKSKFIIDDLSKPDKKTSSKKEPNSIVEKETSTEVVEKVIEEVDNGVCLIEDDE